MSRFYFPQKYADLVLWLTNYKTKLPLYMNELSLTQAEVDEEVALCDKMIEAINLVLTQKNLLNSAINARNESVKDLGTQLRYGVARQKTAKLYTPAIGEDLAVVSSTPEFNPEDFKPGLSVSLFGGKIRIRFTKKEVDGINLYQRQKGSANWKLVSRLTKSPFDYHPVLAVENQPEHFEFRAFGVIKDKEIGLASAIAEIVFGE
jgi:hypothetical protein